MDHSEKLAKRMPNEIPTGNVILRIDMPMVIDPQHPGLSRNRIERATKIIQQALQRIVNQRLVSGVETPTAKIIER